MASVAFQLPPVIAGGGTSILLPSAKRVGIRPCFRCTFISLYKKRWLRPRPLDEDRAAAGGFSLLAPSANRAIWPSPLPWELSVRNIFLRLMNFPIVHHGTKNAERVVSILIALQLFFALLPDGLVTCFCSSANAILYSPDTKVPRAGELVLRRAIPANANMKALQNSLEDISYLLRIPQRKPYGTMEGDVKKALKIATEQKKSILGSIPEQLKAKGSMLYASLLDGKGGLQNLIEVIKEKDPDKVSVGLSSSLDTVAELELLQAPGLSFLLPEQYLELPRLTGRGLVEFIIEKGDGSTFFPSAGGEPKNFAMVQHLYVAKLYRVVDGAYDGVKLMCTNQAILSDNELGNYGYRVPLEVMPSGQFEPLYKTTLSVQDGELPVLPLSVYGAVAMAHSPDSEEYSSPSQFFFYLYDKRNAGLGGLSFDEGQFSVFGYATVGRDVLAEIKSGDFIRSAKLVQGHDRLVLHEEK
ncbi:Peptidyl-prolyl cis-trans isomerase CYP37, chloroplastic [Apostasia shenzhenica]|uniref:Peptidyl-prolyl cis-trans isomerase CYP37, chloroplastic n=1 Tax=Apostasia shenzhenica TaxID=1088818 RepID=A0A2H9ZX64_9ASPA|nr:Peptidyl-prolyl cis-trans isomerase CYP37, chloroplastic [Apostasia shenzhenica]